MTKDETRLLAGTGLAALVVIVVGVTVHATTGKLGTATPPFVMAWGPRALPGGALVAAVALGGLWWGVPRLVRVERAAAFAAGLFAASLTLALAVNAARSGTGAWSHIFDLGPGGSWEAKNEQIAAGPALSYGPGYFLDRFAELVPSLPVHVAGHPPGLPVAMHLLGIDTAGELAALCIAALAAVAPATWALARACGLGEGAARRAGVLACASPGLMLFGVTSADAVFALAGTVAAALLCSGRSGRRVAGWFALGAAALLSWALLAVGAWAVVVAWRRRGWRAAAVLAAGSAVAVLALQGALAAGWGYDPFGTLRATGEVYREGIASIRPYAFWVVGSPVAWGVTAGIPIVAAWLVATARRDAPALALAVVVACSALLGFTKAEVERIWLPFVPLACVAAAAVLPPGRLRAVVGVLAVQALATQLLFATLW